DAVDVGASDPGEDSGFRVRELEDCDAAAGLRHANDLAERAAAIRHVADPERHANGINACGVERERLGVAFAPRHALTAAHRGGLSLGDREHASRGVDAEDAHLWMEASDEEREVAGPRREIEDGGAGCERERIDCAPSPALIDAERDDPVYEIVALCDGV